MQTRESRRISSASASFTACVKCEFTLWHKDVQCIDILLHLIDAGIGRRDGELHSSFHLGASFIGDSIERGCVRVSLREQPLCVQLDGIALDLPLLLFLLGAVVFAIDVAHVMAAVTVGIDLQERRALAGAGSLY